MQKNSLEVTNIWRSYEFFQPIKHYENSFNTRCGAVTVKPNPQETLKSSSFKTILQHKNNIGVILITPQ